MGAKKGERGLELGYFLTMIFNLKEMISLVFSQRLPLNLDCHGILLKIFEICERIRISKKFVFPFLVYLQTAKGICNVFTILCREYESGIYFTRPWTGVEPGFQ